MASRFKCAVCGYIFINDKPPHRCPVCRAESGKFVEVPYEIEPLEETENDTLGINLINLLDLENLEESFDLDGFSVSAIRIEPDEKAEEYSPDKTAMIVVLSGKGNLVGDYEIHHTDESDDNEPENEEITNQISITTNDIITLSPNERIEIENPGEEDLVVLVVK
ncbi:hypothetical protein J7L05_00295 [bacterium]|nr:hypothetical protein [bacterium]